MSRTTTSRRPFTDDVLCRTTTYHGRRPFTDIQTPKPLLDRSKKQTCQACQLLDLYKCVVGLGAHPLTSGYEYIIRIVTYRLLSTPRSQRSAGDEQARAASGTGPARASARPAGRSRRPRPRRPRRGGQAGARTWPGWQNLATFAAKCMSNCIFRLQRKYMKIQYRSETCICRNQIAHMCFFYI